MYTDFRSMNLKGTGGLGELYIGRRIIRKGKVVPLRSIEAFFG
jgi:hypothetical protein